MKVKVYDITTFGFNADGFPNQCQAELTFSPVSGDGEPEFQLLITKQLFKNKKKLFQTIKWAEEQILRRCIHYHRAEKSFIYENIKPTKLKYVNKKALTSAPTVVNAI